MTSTHPTPSDEWIEWSGGECPCDDVPVVSVRLRNGHESTSYPQHYSWEHIPNDAEHDIIAYRKVNP